MSAGEGTQRAPKLLMPLQVYYDRLCIARLLLLTKYQNRLTAKRAYSMAQLCVCVMCAGVSDPQGGG